MEFEYLIYSNHSNIDCSVVVCGVEFHDWHPGPLSLHICWGQSYGIIRYDFTAAALASTRVYSIGLSHTDSDTILSESQAHDPGLGWLIQTLISIIILISIPLIVILPLTGGFLYTRLRRRNVITPQCVQAVEQTLVIKVEQPNEKGSEGKRNITR